MPISKEGLEHCVALLADVRTQIKNLHNTENELFGRLLNDETEAPVEPAPAPVAVADNQVALIAVFNQEGKLLLGKRLDNGKFTLSGGHLNPGEEPADGARRELMEEAALTALTLSPLTTFTTPQGTILHCFSATSNGTPHGQNDPDKECEEWIWVDVSEGLDRQYAENLHGPTDIRYNLLLSLFNIAKKSEPLTKSEDDEISRLLRHPDPVERSLALKLSGLTPEHLDAAAVDKDSNVQANALLHPNFGEDNIKRLVAGENNDAKAALIRLLPNALTPQHLALAFHTSGPDESLHNLLVCHPGLSPDLARVIYQDHSVTDDTKLALLAHANTPDDVLAEALRSGVRFGDNDYAMNSAKAAIAHKAAPANVLEDIVARACSANTGHLMYIACEILEKCKLSDRVILTVLSITKVRAETASMLRSLCMNPHLETRFLDVVISGGNWEMAVFAPNLNPIQIDTLIERLLAKGDKQHLSKLMECPGFGRKHLERLLTPPAPVEEAMAKSEGPDVNEVAQDMIGFRPHNTPAFEAARFLAGGVEPSLEQTRRALHQNDGDIEAAALAAYGFEVTDQTRRALAAVKQMSSLKKGEEAYETATSIESPNPNGEDVAEALRRAYADRFVLPIKLGGRHTKGSLIARDQEGGKTYLIKSGSGQQSPAAGAAQDPSSQSVREAAWYRVAQVLGMDVWYPRAELILIDGREYAVLELLPWSFKGLDKIERQNNGFARSVLQPRLADGTLHQWAVLDYVLGQTDRHGGNLMCSPEGDIRLIDEGAAFAGTEFSPSTDENTFVPYYLRAWSPPVNFNKLPASEKLRSLPRVTEATETVLKHWVTNLSSASIGYVMAQYGIDSAACLARLTKLKAAVAAEPADLAVNKLWTII